MPDPYLPPRDNALRDWLDNFSTLISASPATYGLVAADATAIASVVNDFGDALTIAVNPTTRTVPSVADKDAKKAAALQIVRPYAIQIRNNLGVSNEDKAGLGLTLVDPGKTPIPAPSTNPILSIIGATPGAHTLRFADANTPDKRGKPFGASGLEVWRVIGTTPVMTPDGALFMGMVTRQPFASAFNAADNGKTCTYFARWSTQKGLTGPWSAPVSMTIVA